MGSLDTLLLAHTVVAPEEDYLHILLKCLQMSLCAQIQALLPAKLSLSTR